MRHTKSFSTAVALALMTGISLSQAHAATLFDNFIADQSNQVTGGTAGAASNFNFITDGSVIGGARKFLVQRTSNNRGGVTMDSNLAVSNALSFSEDAGTSGIGTTTYDGTTGTTLNPIGLRNGGATGIDITTGASNGIELFGSADNLGLNIMYTAYTDATHFSTFNFNVIGAPGGGGFARYFARFDQFTSAGSGGGFDPTNLGAFQFSITGLSPNADGTVDLVGSAPENVPEPGSVALLVGMGVSGSVFAMRRRKHA